MTITTDWLVHIGPLRSESNALIEREALPTLIISPTKEVGEGRNILRQAQDEQLPTFEHINTIIAPQTGEATRYHYNLPGFESLAPATGLRALYPGLGETRRQPVETQTLVSVLSEYDELTITHLVLEQPEQALELLNAWQAEGLLEQLDALYVRTSPESLYDGMATQAELTAWCERHGFERHGFEINETNAEDPEFPLLGCKRNALHVPLKDAREEVEALNAKLTEYEALLKENAQQLNRAANALRATDAERHELKEEVDTLRQQRDEQAKTNEAAQAERDKLKQENVHLKQQRDEQAKAKDTAQTEREALKQERETLKQQRDEQAKATEAAKAEATQLKEARDALTQERDQIQKALAETQAKLEQTYNGFMNRKQQVEEGVEKLKILEAERDALKADNEEQAQQHEKVKQALGTAQEERDKYQRYFQSRKQEHEAVQAQLEEAHQVLRDKDATITRLSEQLTAQQQSQEATKHRFDTLERKLEGKLETLFGEQRGYIQQTTNALGQHVTRSAHEHRDEQALTYYLRHGERPAGTTLTDRLTPGYALAMLEHYDTQRPDVALVFGSAATSELLAQTVINAYDSQRKLSNTAQGEQRAVVMPSQDDLPASIISIEHQKAQCTALKKHLQARQTLEAVKVVHAPWVECQHQGQAALFYAVDATLKRLNQWMPEEANVLVVIGPALLDAGHSCVAALSQLLQYLPTHTLDVVVEGTSDASEKELKADWNALLTTRQREAEWRHLPGALGLKVQG